ncbi:MAG: hypothetical protein KF745_14190 [Phycisphaeraceae bacterium]|nr:hypothetical protein [Phycisphaeraceae bacterium]
MTQLKTGQSIRCTITKAPRVVDREQTLLRLMRKDPAISRGLRKAQRTRRQDMVIYNRGNRDWVKRATCGKIARVTKGAQWTMTYTPDLASDFAAVKDYMEVQPA